MKQGYALPINETSGKLEVENTRDAIHEGLLVMDSLHYEIHAGHHFNLTRRVTGDTDAVRNLIVRTPAAINAHTVFTFSSNVAAEIDILESATLTASGTALTARNSDRNSSVTATTELRNTATMSASGTRIEGAFIGGTGKTDVGAMGAGRNERILKVGTVYVFRFTFLADSGKAYMGVNFYEETA